MVTQLFNAQECLRRSGVRCTTLTYSPDAVIFRQGDPANAVLFLQTGAATVSVLSNEGREAVLAILRPGDSLGEGCLAGQRHRANSATAVGPTSVLSIAKEVMLRVLREDADFSSRFMAQIITRNMRVEAALADQCLNSTEKRLARTLLLLAEEHARDSARPCGMPALSQTTLASMVGSTRPRVNFFMNKFRRLGFVEYDGMAIQIQESLATVLGQD